MASKRRIRRNACGSKSRYATEQEAAHAIWRMKQRLGFSLGFVVAYKCKWCKQFHIGHESKIHAQSRKSRKKSLEFSKQIA